MFTESVKDLELWLRVQRTGHEAIQLITSYLLAHGRGNTFRSLPLLARFHDRLGWDNFLEGRISSPWVKMCHHEVKSDNLQTTAESYWAQGLIRRHIQITHR